MISHPHPSSPVLLLVISSVAISPGASGKVPETHLHSLLSLTLRYPIHSQLLLASSPKQVWNLPGSFHLYHLPCTVVLPRLLKQLSIRPCSQFLSTVVRMNKKCMCTSMCVFVYVSVHILYVHAYVCMYIYTCICVYMYI